MSVSFKLYNYWRKKVFGLGIGGQIVHPTKYKFSVIVLCFEFEILIEF
jgi:hypothetical protein